jgi:anti-sigma factor RsiW
VNPHITPYITCYLDDELDAEERRAFEAHVQNCPACEAVLERERFVLTMLRQAPPLYRMPASLRARVEQRLGSARGASPWTRTRLVLALTAIGVVILGFSWFWSGLRLPALLRPQASAFALTAVQTHQRYLRGQLPLEVTSDSPAAISAWFDGKLAFNLKLPHYPENPDHAKPYEVVGARLIGFRQDYVAYVIYRLHNRPISLLVTSATTARPSGGEEIPWQGLRFHFDAIAGWKVLTWSDQGLTYALVSDFEERGQASCIVCHSGAQPRRLWQSVQP